MIIILYIIILLFIVYTYHKSKITSIIYNKKTKLKWYIQDKKDKPSPLVTYENILPLNLLNTIINVINTDLLNKSDFKLSRDNNLMNNERWINLYEKPKDIFEECVLNIAYNDISKTLPKNISKSIKGVSWRVIINNNNIFHFDSDEDLDYLIREASIITPLLSTVTYLTDTGDPTVIYERSRINSKPKNVYISMPKKNKHVAFDPRLFHGTTKGLSTNNNRILLGINYWEIKTQESIKLGSNRLIDNNLVSSSNNNTDFNTIIQTNNSKKIEMVTLKMEQIKMKKKTIIHSFNYGYDLFHNFVPINIIAILPTNNYFKKLQNHKLGLTLCIKLKQSDFNIYVHKNYKEIIQTDVYKDIENNKNKEHLSHAHYIIKNRCSLFEHNNLAMNPQSLNIKKMCYSL